MFLLAAASSSGPSGVNIYFLAALAGVLLAVFTFWEWMKRRHKTFVEECVTETLDDSLDNFSTSLMSKIEAVVREKVDAAYHKIKDDIDPLDRRVTIMETKVDLFWQRMAQEMAAVLHHPEPSRQRVDDLLDNLMTGQITPKEKTELREYLGIIRDWEPGVKAPFEVFQGEQVAAAILLHTMDHVTGSRD